MGGGRRRERERETIKRKDKKVQESTIAAPFLKYVGKCGRERERGRDDKREDKVAQESIIVAPLLTSFRKGGGEREGERERETIKREDM